MDIMPGFTLTDIETSGARIRLRHGGSGPPLLLLHGNPLTHVAWHKVAPRLAERFHVVAADLRGYGDSSAPPEEPDSVELLVPRDGAGPGGGDAGARLSSASSSPAMTAAGARRIACASTIRTR